MEVGLAELEVASMKDDVDDDVGSEEEEDDDDVVEDVEDEVG